MNILEYQYFETLLMQEMEAVSRLQVHIIPFVLVCLRDEFLALGTYLAVEVILNIIIILSAFHHFISINQLHIIQLLSPYIYLIRVGHNTHTLL